MRPVEKSSDTFLIPIAYNNALFFGVNYTTLMINPQNNKKWYGKAPAIMHQIESHRGELREILTYWNMDDQSNHAIWFTVSENLLRMYEFKYTPNTTPESTKPLYFGFAAFPYQSDDIVTLRCSLQWRSCVVVLNTKELLQISLAYEKDQKHWKLNYTDDLPKFSIFSAGTPDRIFFGSKYMILYGENWNSGIQLYKEYNLAFPYAVIPEPYQRSLEVSFCSNSPNQKGQPEEYIVHMSAESTISIYELSPMQVHLQSVPVSLLQNRSRFDIVLNRKESKVEFVPQHDMHNISLPLQVKVKGNKLREKQDNFGLIGWLTVLLTLLLILGLLNFVHYSMKRAEDRDPLFGRTVAVSSSQ